MCPTYVRDAVTQKTMVCRRAPEGCRYCARFHCCSLVTDCCCICSSLAPRKPATLSGSEGQPCMRIDSVHSDMSFNRCCPKISEGEASLEESSSPVSDFIVVLSASELLSKKIVSFFPVHRETQNFLLLSQGMPRQKMRSY